MNPIHTEELTGSIPVSPTRSAAPRVVVVECGVGHAAGRSHHGDRPVPHPDQGSQPARFEHAGHYQQVRADVDQMGQVFAIPDLQVAIRIVVEVALEMPEMVRDAVVVAAVTAAALSPGVDEGSQHVVKDHVSDLRDGYRGHDFERG